MPSAAMPIQETSHKRGRIVRKPKGAEAGSLPHSGWIRSWDPRWKVGYLEGDDGAERAIGIECFGPEGLPKARAGARVWFDTDPSGKVRSAGFRGGQHD